MKMKETATDTSTGTYDRSARAAKCLAAALPQAYREPAPGTAVTTNNGSGSGFYDGLTGTWQQWLQAPQLTWSCTVSSNSSDIMHYAAVDAQGIVVMTFTIPASSTYTIQYPHDAITYAISGTSVMTSTPYATWSQIIPVQSKDVQDVQG